MNVKDIRTIQQVIFYAIHGFHFALQALPILLYYKWYDEMQSMRPGMPTKIQITIGDTDVAAELNDTESGRLVAKALPIEAEFSTWGDEIYFSIPVKVSLENGKDVVDIGELAFWPPGNAFCIFYGATPGSTADMIRPASPVTPLGRVLDDPEIFKNLSKESNIITISKA